MTEEKARDPTKQERKPVNIPLSKIHDLPGSVFAPPSQKSLEALTSSIVLKGVQEPVILRQREDGEFQIVSGNRRRKASEFAKKTEAKAHRPEDCCLRARSAKSATYPKRHWIKRQTLKSRMHR